MSTGDEVTAKQERIFAGYRLLARLSYSDRAEVYRASHPGLAAGKRFVVKRYRSKDVALAQAVGRRCTKLRSISHPSVPAILDVGTASGYPYVARAYSRGIDLQRVVRQLAQRSLALPLEQLIAVMIEVLGGLDIAHTASTSERLTSLSHGDLSPGNILLQFSGRPLILGFETPRGPAPDLPAPVQLDISVPAAVLYAHLRAVHLQPTARGEALEDRRRRLVDAVQPIVRRGLGLDARHAYRQPRDLAEALRDCLDFADFQNETAALVPTLEALAEASETGDHSNLHPLPLQQRRSVSRPLSPALDVGVPEDHSLTGPPLDEFSGPRAGSPAVPAPVDFGDGPQDRRSHPLPAFEVQDGNEALGEETARQISDAFSDILDPFDDRSAEFDLHDLSNPFGFEPDPEALAGEIASARQTQRIGNVLVEAGFVSYRDVRLALEQQGRGIRLGEYMVQEGMISEAQLVHALATLSDARGLTDPEVDALVPDATAVAALPATFVAAHRIVPLSVDSREGVAQLLLVDPSDREALTEARVLLEVQKTVQQLGTRDAVDRLIGRLYPPGIRTEVSSAKAMILIVDPDANRRRPVAQGLRAERFVVEEVDSSRRARQLLRSAVPAAVIVCLSDGREGLGLLREFRALPRANEAYAALAIDGSPGFIDEAEALDADLVPMPLRADYLVAKIRRTLASRQAKHPLEAPPEGVRGNLADMNLLELVQTLRLGRKHASLQIDTALGRGEIALRDGNVIHASFSGEQGDEAFLQLAQVEEGTFDVRYSTEADLTRTVFDSTESLLIEAARRSWFQEDNETGF